jgi:large repetitive protein
MPALFWRAALAAVVVSCVSSCVSLEDDDGTSGSAESGSSEPPVETKTAELTAELAGRSRWAPKVGLSLVPVAAANLPDGRVLFWSGEDRFSFGNDGGKTFTTVFDPATNRATERLVNETAHDMFCPGTAMLADGRILVNGGLSSGKTSIYNPATNAWTSAATMVIPRAYQGTVPLHDGSVFTLGGSWAGGVGNKHGEVWTESAGWRRLNDVPIDPFLSTDPTRNFGMDSHLWLFPTGDGRVFHAGPGINMNWIQTDGNGSVSAAGRRSDDEFSINGSAAMFDVGKLLKTGGGPGYENVPANANSYVIDLNGGAAVRKVQSMAYRRGFHNSVVLPNGQVVVLGGMTQVVGFSDSNAVLAPEIFDPVSETFTALPPMATPRNYHSVGLLLPDARVLSAGGGLCGNCAANHADLEILSPYYLFKADGTLATRPVIQSAPSSANHGTTITVTTSTPVSAFSIVRNAATTHTVNNDQRRLPLSFTALGSNRYGVQIPSNPGWAVPGLYMLFALDADGVPSVATSLQVGASSLLRIAAVGEYGSTLGVASSLALQTIKPAGATLTFSATGLPPGVSVQASTGTISGAATSAGRFVVEARVSDGQQTVSTQFVWTVVDPGNVRFVRLEALSEVKGNPWSSAAEVNLVDDNGRLIPRTAWIVTADSSQNATGNESAGNVIDGNPATFWHTQYTGTTPALPHRLIFNLGGAYRVSGLKYLPRQDGNTNGTIARFQVYVSVDGNNWGAPVASGDFTPLAAQAAEKTIYFGNLARGKAASQSSTNGAAVASRAADGDTASTAAGNSLALTNSQATPFWEVDLGASYQLFGARLWNRTDGTDTLNNLYVLTSETPMSGKTLAQLLADANVGGTQIAGAAGAVSLVSTSKRARYLRVQLAGTAALQLAEVEVFGRLGDNRAPTLGAVADQRTTTGTAVQLQLSASDPDGDALSYSASGLPSGLTLTASSGLVSGTPSSSGSFTANVSVRDGRGGAASTTFNWFVGAPTATLQSVAAPALSASGTATYTASTSAGNFEFAWDFGDGTPTTAFSSSPTVTHTFVTPGVYRVTLTARNADGSASSRTFYQAVTTAALPGRASASSGLALEPRGAASARLWVVNQDNASVSVFDTGTSQKLKEIAVGAQPRTVAVAADGQIWVVNKGAASISILSPSTLAVSNTVSLPRGSQPYGLVFGTHDDAFVALEATGTVLKLSNTGAVVGTLAVGANPRHLAMSALGDRLLVARFITSPQVGEATVSVPVTVNGAPQGAEVLVLDPGNLSVQRVVTLKHSELPDTTISGRGVPNYLGAPAISPDGASAWVPSKQDNIARGGLRSGQNLDFQNTLRAISSRIDLATLSEDYPARVDHDNSGLASAAVYHPNGAYLFVALETSRQLAVLDAVGKRELFRVEAGRAPQGVQVSADGKTLFVHNFMDRTVSVFDLARLVDFGESALPLTRTLASVATEALSAQVLRGKQLFYDARDTRLARDSYISCAACHNDGGHDGRVWDMTGFGEGLRNTIALNGRAGMGHGALHWSGNFDEVQDFEMQIRSLAGGTGLLSNDALNVGTRAQPLGDKKAGLGTDLDALAAYVGQLNQFAPSPYRPGAGTLSAAASAGAAVFARVGCASCHAGVPFTSSRLDGGMRNVGTLKTASGNRLGAPLTGLDVPTLRDVWSTAPYLHDGSAPTLAAAVQAHAGNTVTGADLPNLVAYLQQLDGSDKAPTPYLPNGVYRLVAVHSNQVLDVAGISRAAGAMVTQWPWINGDNQRWKLTATGNGQYTIAAQHSGLLLEVAGCSTSDGGRVQQWPANGAACQAWRLVDAGDGSFTIVNVNSGKVLDVSGISLANGAAVTQWTGWGGANQRWRIEPVSTNNVPAGTYRLTPTSRTSAALDVAGVSTAPGAAVWQYGWVGANNQRWIVAPTSDGYFELAPAHAPTLRLEVVGGMLPLGARVQQGAFSGSAAQRWSFELLGDGSYRVTNVNSGRALDVEGCSQADGAPVQQWDWQNSACQKWRVSAN